MQTPRIMPGRARLRVRGSLLAAACGQALATPFVDGEPGGDAFDAHARAAQPLVGNGDTLLMLAYAHHLAAPAVTEDAERLLDRFVDTWRAEPDRGYRPDIGRQLAANIGAAHRVLRPSGDGASAAPAVRSAPAGLLPLPLSDVAAVARAGAAITHTHPAAQEGAAVLACAVALAFTGDAAHAIDRAAFAHRLARFTNDSELTENISGVAALGPGTAATVTARLVGATEVRQAVPAAVAAFLRHPDNPAAAIRFAVTIGGDRPAIAAMTGAMVGARCGGGVLPSPWLRRLQDRELICAAADALAAGSHFVHTAC